MDKVLSGMRIILLVEDEHFIARDLTDALNDAGAVVVGPYARLSGAISCVAEGELDAAVLDVNLAGELSFSLVDNLVEAKVPHVLVTGYDEWALPAAYRDHARISKPFQPNKVIEVVDQLVHGARRP